LDIVASLQEQKDDGFFIYNFKEPISQKISKKLSYVYHYKPFNWYIGTGIHIHTLDKYLSAEMQHLEDDLSSLIKRYLYISLFLVLFLAFAIYLIIRYIQNKQHNLVQYENILKNIKNEIAVYYWICSIEKEQFYCIETSSNHLDHIQNIDDMLKNVVKNDYTYAKSFFEQLVYKKETQTTEFRLVIHNNIRYFKCYCNFVYNKSQKKDEVMIVLVDITIYKQKEIQMIEDQLVSIQGKIDRDFLDFINMIAHQWRHPISYINSKLIDLDIEPFDKKEFVQDIENTTEFLSNTIEDFAAVFSSQNTTSSMLLEDCFKNVLKILKPKLVNVELHRQCQKGLYIEGNSTKLQQILMVILKNSIDAFHNAYIVDETIWIKTTTHLGYIVIEISDNAKGAKQDEIEKLFDLYYTTKHGENKGLGLYMAKLLIERFFNGTIKIKNHKQGFKTTLFIPIENRNQNEV
jgi:signal transduction histidine kinase